MMADHTAVPVRPWKEIVVATVHVVGGRRAALTLC